jgi:small subunit ribosomal protein S16
MGNRHRPFYRVVVAKSTAARDGAFIEIIGTYNPLTNPKQIAIDGDKALDWLMKGAQPTETVAYLLKKEGVLDRFFENRPNAKKDYGFLDKTTSATTVQSMATAATGGTATATEEKTETKEEPAPAEEAKVEEAKEGEGVKQETPSAEEAKPEEASQEAEAEEKKEE